MFKKLQVSLIRKFARKRLGKDIAPLETIATHRDVDTSASFWRVMA